MTAASVLTTEQITALYADFAQVAVTEYNANGMFKAAIFLVARRVDGYVIAEIPDGLTNSFLSSEPDRLEFIVRAMLTDGTPARNTINPKPDAVVIITEAFDMAVPRNEDGSVRAPTVEEITEAATGSNDILAVQLFTATEAWAGMSKITGTPKRATFSPDVRKVAAFVTMPIEAPTVH
jgi:hypothetical protein